MIPEGQRPSFAQINLSAITNNVRMLREHAGTKEFCAVVKADGYGHGAIQAANAALAGGATLLAVALVEEAVTLRNAGVTAPTMILSEPPRGSESTIAALGLITTVYSEAVIDRLSAAGGMAGATIKVHIKVDTGMHRVGCAPGDAVNLAKRVVAAPNLLHVGTFTHLAVADAPELSYTGQQLDTFDKVIADLRLAGIDPGTVHAANSQGQSHIRGQSTTWSGAEFPSTDKSPTSNLI
jgi:alanine racemase